MIRTRSRVRVQLLFTALALQVGCDLNTKGLAPTTGDGSVGGPRANGTGGAMGAGGTIGIGGALGTGGGVGSGGGAGTGGVVGTGGGVGSGGGAGTGGTLGTGGSGTGGLVGTGGISAAGGGAAGGRGGATVTCGPSTCPNGCCSSGNTCVANRTNTLCGSGGGACAACAPCFQCSANGGACALNQSSRWTINCLSATIAPQKPGLLGQFWDLPVFGSLSTSIAPDPFCEFQLDEVGQADTGVLTDTFSPMWNQSIAPSTMNLTPNFLISEAGNWSVFVGDDDGGLQRFENVCTVFPNLTAANFTTGILRFANVQSCTSLTIQLVCAQN